MQHRQANQTNCDEGVMTGMEEVTLTLSTSGPLTCCLEVLSWLPGNESEKYRGGGKWPTLGNHESF